MYRNIYAIFANKVELEFMLSMDSFIALVHAHISYISFPVSNMMSTPVADPVRAELRIAKTSNFLYRLLFVFVFVLLTNTLPMIDFQYGTASFQGYLVLSF